MDMVATSWRLTPQILPQLSPKVKSFRVYSSSSSLSPSPITQKTLSSIQNSGVIACLRANSAALAYEAATAAVKGGISVLEIVMSTPGVFQVLRQLVKDYPTLALGVGTVLNAEDARNSMNAGAKFLTSPATVKDIMDDFQKDEVLYIPGVMTPTEILSAYDAGSKIVKVSAIRFPYLTKLVKQLVMRWGCHDLTPCAQPAHKLYRGYISSGASSVVLSDAIFNQEAMAQRNFSAVYQLASLAALEGKEAVERGVMTEMTVHGKFSGQILDDFFIRR
ncbi:unnamed protein product [Dovyalis caffra]|uniref:KHG/KDPG aldolase n=1 Tax=Dovyalis caffra TaxID=77055 RepID=A0AAV1RL37_9ROSI|nr:unnamed protein product [Dovyalis caffra]